ncbi:putative multi-domain containing protein [Aduncisulcus paluster]|uniref:Palmitoyl-protein thioesterase 1 n=1 Tax=Aduncisulcus paluster TaxID=2918883 RepID=A0ABQ5KNA2_9EUKA|nr:putative multi-domain containing protein [Aduncisulcus paluster]
MMHGINCDHHWWDTPLSWMEERYPDTYFLNVEVGDGYINSIFSNPVEYIDEFAQTLKNDPNLSDGIVLMGHSQGTFVTRAYIEMYNDPPVIAYISLAGVHGGFFGDDLDDVPLFGIEDNDLAKLVGTFLYELSFQDFFMPAGYWRDPMHLDVYREYSSVLAYINNEVSHPNRNIYKERLSSLDLFVLVGAPNDGVINPYISSWFGFYSDGSTVEFTYLEDNEDLWTNDVLGLKSLFDDGKLLFLDSGLYHNDYKREVGYDFFVNTLLPLVDPYEL